MSFTPLVDHVPYFPLLSGFTWKSTTDLWELRASLCIQSTASFTFQPPRFSSALRVSAPLDKHPFTLQTTRAHNSPLAFPLVFSESQSAPLHFLFQDSKPILNVPIKQNYSCRTFCKLHYPDQHNCLPALLSYEIFIKRIIEPSGQMSNQPQKSKHLFR